MFWHLRPERKFLNESANRQTDTWPCDDNLTLHWRTSTTTCNLRKIFNKPKEGDETEMTLEHVILYKPSSFQAFKLSRLNRCSFTLLNYFNHIAKNSFNLSSLCLKLSNCSVIIFIQLVPGIYRNTTSLWTNSPTSISVFPGWLDGFHVTHHYFLLL